MIRILMPLALILGAASAPSRAHDLKIASAHGLKANCNYKSDDQGEVEFHYGFCLGFIKAVMNMHPTHGETFCIPETADNGVLTGAVRKMLDALPPEMMNAASHVVIGATLETAFPCSKK